MNNMEGTFDGIYINHPANKHDEWSEEKKSTKEAFQKWKVSEYKGLWKLNWK